MLENRSGWRNDRSPNREVTRMIGHLTVSGAYEKNGEPLSVFVPRGKVSFVTISPSFVDGCLAVWNGDANDPRLVLLGADLKPVKTGKKIKASDITVEVVIEVG